MSHYIYQNTGGPAWCWRNGAPRNVRGADNRSLGASFIPGGSPEPLTGLGDSVGTLVKVGVIGILAVLLLRKKGKAR